MEITKENIDELNAVVKIRLKPEDYSVNLDKAIAGYSKKAALPGFRQGKVPASVIRKMYGKSFLVEELNKILSEKLYAFINENEIDILGNPMPKPSEKEQDWDNPGDFEFLYELGLSPDFEVVVSPDEKFDYYNIEVTDEMVEKYVNDIRRRYGKFIQPEISADGDILYGTFRELDSTGNIFEGGIESASSLAIDLVKSEKIKNKLIGIKKEATVDFNPHETAGNIDEIASLLGIEKAVAENVKSDFRFTVNTVNRVEKADLTEELFNKIYGEGTVNSEAEFRNKVKEEIESIFRADSDRKLNRDMKNGMLKKYQVGLPNDFLKRWLISVNEKPLSNEDLEKDYPVYADELRWKLIQKRFVGKYNITISDEEIDQQARNYITSQFSQYGHFHLEEEKLKSLVEKFLENPDQVSRIRDHIAENKVYDLMRSVFILDTKVVSYEDFVKIASH